MLTFANYGIENWIRFLTGPGLIIIIAFVFTNLAYGILNKKITFVPPTTSNKEKSKWNFRPPEGQGLLMQSPFQRRQSEIPTSLHYSKCGVCNQEKLEDELFTHPDGFRICSECILRGKRNE